MTSRQEVDDWRSQSLYRAESREPYDQTHIFARQGNMPQVTPKRNMGKDLQFFANISIISM
jgi:hypothetical protein